MTHAVVIANKIGAKDNDAWVRPVVSACAVDNGTVFCLRSKSGSAFGYSTDETTRSEVWNATYPISGSLTGLWMALEPELPSAFAGTKQYRGLGTVQDFYTPAGQVFTAVKLQTGDIITLTADALTGAHSTGSYVTAIVDVPTLDWAASGLVGTALTLKLLDTTYISIPDGGINSGRTTAYMFEVMQN